MRQVKLRLCGVAYLDFEADGAAARSMADPEAHGVELGGRLTGPAGEAVEIWPQQMDDLDWLEVHSKATPENEPALEMTRSRMWRGLVGEEVIIDLPRRRPRVIELRTASDRLYCWASGDDRVIVQRSRPDIEENPEPPLESRARPARSEQIAPSRGERARDLAEFLAQFPLFALFVWPPWFLVFWDAREASVVALPIVLAIVAIRWWLIHTERLLFAVNALAALGIGLYRLTL